MAIVDRKKSVFGKIAAIKTLNDGYPSLKRNASFPSVNNNGDVISFLLDLQRSLVGFDDTINVIVDILTYSMGDIEIEIKKAIIDELKSIVSCDVNPLIPAFMFNPGIVVDIKDIDFFDLLKVKPNSVAGNLVYDKSANNRDFNLFLFNALQTQQINTWKNSQGTDILDVEFNNTNNQLTIRINQNYNGLTLDEFNNDFINSIELFKADKILNGLVDIIYGTISQAVNLTTSILEKIDNANRIIENIISMKDTDILNDDIFNIKPKELLENQKNALNKSKGINVINLSTSLATSIPIGQLTSITDNFNNALNIEDKRKALTTGINEMGEFITFNVQDAPDIKNTKSNFIDKIIRTLVVSITNSLFSPKIIIPFIINYKIINGQAATYNDTNDFIKQNKTLIRAIIKKVRNAIVKKLLEYILKQIAVDLAKYYSDILKEKYKNKLVTRLSLAGVDQRIIRLIKGL